ncbi:M20/M25/M40 family metallo-hydrolase [Lentilactobacillus sp. Marseille-Q4993]|uniref:M20/M25/M40 family metallo-hydrolase n=1 Tax=Lentilactobacillus sp. Marseille-Q4993 TaxID=3039492 RepID=UPI0024BC1422|nr:M20/M25/M40 family metallo-hydrolase [Lentilactobacillus sp. Marseille-Q4993]
MKDTEKIQIVKDLININSANGNEGAVADYLINLFRAHGIRAVRIEQKPGRSNVVAEIGTGHHPIVGLAGHEDTVAVGDESKWRSNPFEAETEGNVLTGLGASDMKAGLAQFAITFIELHEEDMVKTGTIRFIATISEELTAEGAAYIADEGYVSDLDVMMIAEPTGVPVSEIDRYFNGGAFIDSNSFFKLKKSVEGLPEDDEQHFIVTAHKGWMTYTVTAHGKAAHSSMPKLGVNAVDTLIKYYVAEKDFYQGLTERNSTLGETVYAPDIFHGGEQVNSIPDLAYERVKVRTIPELPNEELIIRLRDLVAELNQHPDVNLELTVDYSERPVISDDKGKMVQILQKNAATTLQQAQNLPTIGVSLGTDASEFTRINPDMEVVILGPGNTSAHQVNEYLHLDTYLKMFPLFKRSIVDYLK